MALATTTTTTTTYPGPGNVARLSVEFYGEDGTTLTDPSTVTVKVQPPKAQGGTITANAIRDSTGVYHYDLTLSNEGTYRYYFIGTGTVIAQSKPNSITVPPAEF